MKPRKKGKQYEVSYRCPGSPKQYSEYFPTLAEANRRVVQIQCERADGTFRPPDAFPAKAGTQKRDITVGELMDEYVQVYGLDHWGDSYLSYSRHRIEHYIKPYLGDVRVRDLTTHGLDLFYHSLREKPAVILKGHKHTDATVSPQVIEKTHALLRSALNQAVKWEYIPTNPAERVTLPHTKHADRAVWSISEAKRALDCCEDPALRLAMLLALGCSMRIGEILGLTWDCADCSDESLADGTASVFINKQLRRCQKQSLQSLEACGRSQVVYTFPEYKQTGCSTALVLTAPKTQSSVRKVFLPKTVGQALQAARQQQDALKLLLGAEYADHDLVIAHEDGRPYEERQIAALLREMIAAHDLPPVVFHSLRHCSASLKLQIGGGNIKAVQGDTGHAQARMVTDLYAHTHNEDRRLLAQKMEADFFQASEKSETEQKSSDVAAVMKMLENDPQLTRLLLALMDKKNTV